MRNQYNTDAILLAMKHNQEMKEAVNREMLKEEITEQITQEVTEQVTKEVTEEVTKEVTEQVTKEVTEQVMEKGKVEGAYNTQREVTMSIFKVKYPNTDVALISDLTLEQYKAIFNLLLQDAPLKEIETIIHMN